MNISPSTVSHHLKELRNAGLIQMKRRGQKVECSVDFSTVRGLIDFFNGWFEHRGMASSNECLSAVTPAVEQLDPIVGARGAAITT